MRGPVNHVYYDAVRQLERVENVFREVHDVRVPYEVCTQPPVQAERLGERLGGFMARLRLVLGELHEADINGTLDVLHEAGITAPDVD